MNEQQERVVELQLKPIPEGLAIKSGAHESFNDGACVMEIVAYVAGEPFSDHPACACPVVTRYAQALNDRMPSDEMRTELLLPLVPVIAGSRSTPEVEEKRRWLAIDFAVREAAPRALCSAASMPGCKDLLAHAAILQALPPVTRENSAVAQAACREARSAAYAADAADAAYAAAYAADAADAAYAAAYAAYAAAYAYAADASRREVFALAAGVLRKMCEVKA